MQKSWHHPSIQVAQRNNRGRGLVAFEPIAKGTVLVRTHGRTITTAEIATMKHPYHPFQIEKDVLLAPVDESSMDGIFLTNHSCDPNAGILAKVELVALRDIKPQEEICFDYAMTDSDPQGLATHTMQCHCESGHCRKIVTDLDWRNPTIQHKYKGYFSEYLAVRISELK